MANFSDLKGKILTRIDVVEYDEKIYFTTDQDQNFVMYHRSDCCESVNIEDICGDLNDLLNSPILLAEEVTNSDNPKGDYDESFTWTFYKLSTNLGSVTIRWYGSSNGYYSESVDFIAKCFSCDEEVYDDYTSFCGDCKSKIPKYIPEEQHIYWWKEKENDKKEKKLHNTTQ